MKKRLLLVVIFTITGAGLAVPKVLPLVRGAAPPSSPAPDARAAARPASPPLRVQALKLEPTPLAETITATGSLRADEAVELQAETSGKVVAISFTEGSRVTRGELLLKINDSESRAALKRATARKALAQAREARLAHLLREGGTNQQDYDAAASDLQVQAAEIQLIEAQIEKTEIRAPFDGVIGLRFVSEGSYVSPATRIATLQNLASVKLDFAVPEKYAPRVRTGSPVKFSVAGESALFAGEVYAIEPRVDVTTRTVLLRALCPNPGQSLRPGAFANVQFKLDEVAGALLVPAAAVAPGMVDSNVFVVEDGRAKRRTVRTGTRTELAVEIIDGLRAGDVVITSGLQSLRAGQTVEPQFRVQ